MKALVISGHTKQVAHADFLPWFAKWEIVPFAISGLMLLASLCTGIYLKSFPVPKSIQID